MTTRREFLTTGTTLVVTGAVLTESLAACAPTAIRPSEPALDQAKPIDVDDTQTFVQMSALLTGLQDLLSENDLFLKETMAKEYARRLRGTFPDDFPALLKAYKGLAAADPPPQTDDALLAKFRATNEFTKNGEMVAKQIVNIWYFSQFCVDCEKKIFIDGGFYERGYVWALIKAPPVGFSTKRPGYWSVDPAKEATI